MLSYEMVTPAQVEKNITEAPLVCGGCGGRGKLHYHGYSPSDIDLCASCAKQLARKILEDLCALETPGGRRG